MGDNIYPYPDIGAIEEEAAAWMILLDGDSAPSPEELAALRAWLARSPVHRKTLTSMAHFWSNNVLAELAVPLTSKEARKTTRPPLNTLMWRFIPVAAALLLLIISAVFSMPWYGEHRSNGLYATTVGQQKTVTLADGSTVHLNTNSQVDVKFDREYRDIHLLQGEAHFTVTKDNRHPFRVYVGNNRVQAVGTAFAVHARGSEVDVIVTEGKVLLEAMDTTPEKITTQNLPPAPVSTDAVNENDNQVRKLSFLGVGQKITVPEAQANKISIGKVEAVDAQTLEKQLSWRKGFLVFNGEPLHAVVQEISRYTTVTIEIADPILRDIQVGGQLQIGDTEPMLDALEANFGLQVTRLGYSHVRLSATHL